MQIAAWILIVWDHLRAELVSAVDQASRWSDRLYWNGYAPLGEGVIIIAAGAAVAVCVLAWIEEKDVEVWSAVTIAGRWMGCIAAIVVVLAVGAGHFIAA